MRRSKAGWLSSPAHPEPAHDEADFALAAPKVQAIVGQMSKALGAWTKPEFQKAIRVARDAGSTVDLLIEQRRRAGRVQSAVTTALDGRSDSRLEWLATERDLWEARRKLEELEQERPLLLHAAVVENDLDAQYERADLDRCIGELVELIEDLEDDLGLAEFQVDEHRLEEELRRDAKVRFTEAACFVRRNEIDSALAQGRERRPACNQRSHGSRRGATRSSAGEPPGEDDHHRLGLRPPARGRQ